MKKLKLDLDALEIDSFDPAPLEDAEGTVIGEALITPTQGWYSCVVVCTQLTCVTCRYFTCVTCYITCGTFTCIPTACIPQICQPISGGAFCQAGGGF